MDRRYCDRCGKELHEKDHGHYLNNWIKVADDVFVKLVLGDRNEIYYNVHACKSCSMLAILLLKHWWKAKEVE